MVTYVLDYSSGYPAPAAVTAGGYAGVVRYIGTPGRGKNLTRAEAQAMLAAGVPIGLVYEATAGWMLGGVEVGAGAARAALADAAQCGVEVRCVYFAADFDVTDAQQMQAVGRTLDGAAQVLGRARVGVYGEADVIDACLGGGHAAWGWQTRAWSGARVSVKAHLLQQIGYVYPGGVQCDRSTVLKPDWGQWPLEDDVTAEEVWSYALAVPKGSEDLFALASYPAQDWLRGPNVRAALLARQVTALSATVNTMSGLLAAGATDLTADEVKAAVVAALAENEVHVDISVAGHPVPPAGPSA